MPEEHERRDLDQGEEEDQEHQAQHAGAREQDEVAGQNAGDRAGGPDRRRCRARVDRRLERDRGEAGEHVEQREAQAAERVLDVRAEDPQEDHVAAEMQQPAVHEHRAERRDPRRRLPHRIAQAAAHDLPGVDLMRPDDRVSAVRAGVRQFGRDRAELDQVQHVVIRARVAERDPTLLPEEVGDHVGHDQRDRHDRKAPGGHVVLQREHVGRSVRPTSAGRANLRPPRRRARRRARPGGRAGRRGRRTGRAGPRRCGRSRGRRPRPRAR